MEIPKWSGKYFPNVNDQSPSVQKAYWKIKQSWDELKMMNISSNKEPHTSYYIHYYYDLVRRFLRETSQNNYQEIKLRFNKLIENDTNNTSKSMRYAVRWLNDMAWIMGDYNTVEANAHRYLNCNYYNEVAFPFEYFDLIHLTEKVKVDEILFPLFFDIYQYLTDYGKNYYDEITEIVVKNIKQNDNIKNFFYEILQIDQRPFTRFSGVPDIDRSNKMIDLNYSSLSFKLNANSRKQLKKLAKDAENEFRNQMNIPEIGAGWLSETVLFENLKQSFPDTEILQHAKPIFLGRQHFDVYFPEYKLAVEYHGRQHFEPVDFFGGIEAYKANIERDQRKMRISQANNVKIIVVQEGYDYSELIYQIVNHIKEKCNKTITPRKLDFDSTIKSHHQNKVTIFQNIDFEIVNKLTPRQSERYQVLLNKDLSILSNFTSKFLFELSNYKKFAITPKYIEETTKKFLDIFYRDKKENYCRMLSDIDELVSNWYSPSNWMLEGLVKYYEKVGLNEKAMEIIELHRILFEKIHLPHYLEESKYQFMSEKKDELQEKINAQDDQLYIRNKHKKLFVVFEEKLKYLQENSYDTSYEKSMIFLENLFLLLKMRSKSYNILELPSTHAGDIFQMVREYFTLLLDVSYLEAMNRKHGEWEINYNAYSERNRMNFQIGKIVQRLVIDATKMKEYQAAYEIAEFGHKNELYYKGDLSFKERLNKIATIIEGEKILNTYNSKV